MPTTTTVTVTTEDAQPTVAPHKISDKTGFTDVSAPFTPTHDGQIVPSHDLLPNDSELYPTSDSNDPPLYPGATDADPPFPDQGALIPGIARDVVGFIVKEGGSDPTSGKTLAQGGTRCGALPCSSSRPCSSTDLRIRPGAAHALAFTYAQANDGAGDGTRTVNVWVLTENQGWS